MTTLSLAIPAGAGRARRPELVLFDCDGTLLESEALMCEVQVRRFSALGIPCTLQELSDRYTGVSNGEMLKDLGRRHGVSIGAETVDAIEAEFSARIDRDLRPTSGTPELLAAMPVPFCLASNAPRHRLIRMLRGTGLLHHFGPRIVSAHDVSAGKPAPDVFLLAAELMGVSPDACLVIEDSVPGLHAARAAGMGAAVFLGASHQTERTIAEVMNAHPDHVLETLPDLLDLLSGEARN